MKRERNSTAKEAEVKTLADNAARTKDELELKLTAAEQKAGAAEASLAQAAAEREELEAKILFLIDIASNKGTGSEQ